MSAQMAVRRPSVGRNVRRKDGDGKVTGSALYIDDLRFPGMLYGTTVRSTIPCGEIAAMKFPFETRDFVIVDARDIPGRNAIERWAD
jgi:xanthine dehydrogenase molybdopterin-binding subunit B